MTPSDGFSLVDSMVAIAILGIILTPTVTFYQHYHQTSQSLKIRWDAMHLARNLQAEIQKRVHIPSKADNQPGPEYDESNRAQYDDVNDYHNYTANPYVDPTGHEYTDLTATVRVVPGTFVNERFSETADGSIHKITIVVKKEDEERYRMTWFA